jgi:hypothetical protein
MSGGLAVKTKKRGVVRAGGERSEPTTRPAFFARLGLDGLGAAGPRTQKRVSRRLLLNERMGA